MGYVPKQGQMTIEDVEQELEMLAKRMEFLGQTLPELKKENAKNMQTVCGCLFGGNGIGLATLHFHSHFISLSVVTSFP